MVRGYGEDAAEIKNGRDIALRCPRPRAAGGTSHAGRAGHAARCAAGTRRGRRRYLFSAMVEMARCAVPARVVAGGMNFRATMAFEGVAPLHGARTSPRDVPN